MCTLWEGRAICCRCEGTENPTTDDQVENAKLNSFPSSLVLGDGKGSAYSPIRRFTDSPIPPIHLFTTSTSGSTANKANQATDAEKKKVWRSSGSLLFNVFVVHISVRWAVSCLSRSIWERVNLAPLLLLVVSFWMIILIKQRIWLNHIFYS